MCHGVYVNGLCGLWGLFCLSISASRGLHLTAHYFLFDRNNKKLCTWELCINGLETAEPRIVLVIPQCNLEVTASFLHEIVAFFLGL
jgi:hypothetical protein